jgi:GT2 family glycosyltransferase
MTIAVVAIGRNEGERLKRCLQSAVTRSDTVVYVDSGSTDDSVNFAQSLGVHVVSLDMTHPFTAARARNEGFDAVLSVAPETDFVQFVDGDCELHPDWLHAAAKFLLEHPNAAAVCGRRRERAPEASIYNMLCDLEWNTPVGEARACGGDVLMRARAMRQVGGYNPSVIAGEEPELCIRLRQHGWKIWRMDHEMTLHDANITKLSQWWNRAKRCGYAYALGQFMHGQPPERHWIPETRRALIWGLVLPVVILGSGIAMGPWALVAAGIYPLQMIRMARRSPLKPAFGALQDGALNVLTKFAETQGVLKFWRDRCAKTSAQIIEYK